MGKRELVALLCLFSWCLVIVVWLFLAVPRVCLQFEIVLFSDHTHLLFLSLGAYLTYLAPTGQFSQVSNCLRDPLNAKTSCPKNKPVCAK